MFPKIFLGLLIVIVVAAVILLTIGYLISAPRYKGPVSDHFDGKRFHNYNGMEAKSFPEALQWMLSKRDKKPWGAFHPVPPGPPPPAHVAGSQVRVTFVNHSTVLLQFDSLNVVTDPVWYDRTSPYQWIGPERNRPPGIRFEDLPKIHILLLSHNHWDHLDIKTVQKICQRDQPKVYCPLGVKAFLEEQGCKNVTEMDWNGSLAYNDSTTIHCVPAQHFSGRGMFDRDATLWCGFVIDSRVAGKLYFVGDTGYGPFFRKIGEQYGPMRLSLIPIGAFRPTWFMGPIHCSPAEAVQIHEDVRSQQSVAIHYGTFPLADDGETEPVDELHKTLRNHPELAERFWTLPEGAGRLVP
ncbi:MBL fold metallo-hydrolase [Larkinella arboricola]|uniref:L-ascorbate metabolism protein UlaG (Beta-lactamase superfamily) n=1 Tax=Larkinella arboricola TaxID=643671 RepID=A0A327X6C4_LARAB|nr:MBL fold metallo-hydrolase [Larkinella arboricola]RAK02485.1 L-ascorbate metabolism protein UlaG (beta-lactamase superfamily) [Larkinella arboricola]